MKIYEKKLSRYFFIIFVWWVVIAAKPVAAGNFPTIDIHPPPLKQMIEAGRATAKKGEAGLKKRFKDMTDEQRNVRIKALREAANTQAFQKGVSWQYNRINQHLEGDKITVTLDNTFNFQTFLIAGKLLPPIIVRSGQSFTVINNDMAVETDQTYRMISKAKIVAAPPSWRDYLVKHYKTIENINPILLPMSAAENQQWAAAVKTGWEEGISQAWRLFEIGIKRLVRAYLGLEIYLKLQKSNILSAPYLSGGRYAVKITDSGAVLDLNRRVFRITEHPEFNPKPDTWVPSVYEHNEGDKNNK